MRLGSAFKSKFHVIFKDDNLLLNRNYFPGVDPLMKSQTAIINEIEEILE
jgi:hypothetical protein